MRNTWRPIGFAGSAVALLRLRNPRSDVAWLRAVERMPTDMSVRYWKTWPQPKPTPAKVMDLSLTGLRFLGKESLGRDQLIKLDSELLQAIGRVVHCQQVADGWQIGVEFVTLRFARTRGAFVSDQV
jgi:hypothetical protein